MSFGAASRQLVALGPGSHSAYAACARESSGESGAQTLNRAFPEACNAAKRSGRLSGTQRKTREAPLTLPFAEVSERGREGALELLRRRVGPERIPLHP